MIAETDALKYGALGFGFLVMLAILWLIVRPIVGSFVSELQENRKERTEQREQFLGFIKEEARGQTEAMQQVKDGMAEIVTMLRRMNGGHEGQR